MTSESEYISVQIVDDSDSDEVEVEVEEEIIIIVPNKKKKVIKKKGVINETKVIKEIKEIKEICLLQKFLNSDTKIIEIGVDEVGRGPMFGRVYCAAAVLPKDDSFDHYKMKDSKKFSSKNTKKIIETSEYIKTNALAWAIEYEDEKVIDEINILQATQSAMHKAIRNVIGQLIKRYPGLEMGNVMLLIDGNYFKPFLYEKEFSSAKSGNLNGKPFLYEKGILSNKNFTNIQFQTVEGGDNKYTAIAAASILAKVERDKYILDLCALYPDLIEKYALDSNKGYGSKVHLEGIRTFGITKWHRRTFGICKTFI
jgi:ribonuclease HII